MKKISILALVCVSLVSCSKKHDAAPAAGSGSDGKPQGHFTVTSPKLPDDPVQRKAEQERMVESMVDTPEIDLGTLQGEAYRRGVKLTDAQIARKKANKKIAPGAVPAPPAPAVPTADATQSPKE